MGIETKQMTCKIHGSYTAKVINVLGTEIVMKCPKCKEIEDAKKQKEAEFEAKKKEAERIALWLDKSGLPPIYRNIENFEFKPAQMALKDYDFKKNLVLYGGVGTGKTMVASYIGVKAIRNNLTVRYLYANEIEKRVKSSWGSTYVTEDDIIDQFVNCDLLVLDEIGRVVYNDYLFKVFDSRYMNHKPTVIIGNIDVKEIPNILGEAIASRLRTNVQAVCFGVGDMRASVF